MLSFLIKIKPIFRISKAFSAAHEERVIPPYEAGSEKIREGEPTGEPPCRLIQRDLTGVSPSQVNGVRIGSYLPARRGMSLLGSVPRLPQGHPPTPFKGGIVVSTLLFSFCFVPNCLAQSAQSSLFGTVVDQSGAPLADVRIEAGQE